MVSQCRYALSRQSSSHCGSPFLWLMKRTTSSFSPGGAESASMSVTNPHLYSRFASVSISRSAVGMTTHSIRNRRETQMHADAMHLICVHPRSSAVSSALGAERRSAPAGARRVRVLEDEPAAHHLVLEVDLGVAGIAAEV